MPRRCDVYPQGQNTATNSKCRETRDFRRLSVSPFRRLISPVGIGNWLISGSNHGFPAPTLAHSARCSLLAQVIAALHRGFGPAADHSNWLENHRLVRGRRWGSKVGNVAQIKHAPHLLAFPEPAPMWRPSNVCSTPRLFPRLKGGCFSASGFVHQLAETRTHRRLTGLTHTNHTHTLMRAG